MPRNREVEPSGNFGNAGYGDGLGNHGFARLADRRKRGAAEGPLFDQPLAEPRLRRAGEPLEHAEHAVGVDWRKTVETNQAKWFKGGFANQNIVCKLRDEATVDFLLAEFGVQKRA